MHNLLLLILLILLHLFRPLLSPLGGSREPHQDAQERRTRDRLRTEFEEHAQHLLRQLEPVEEEEVDGGDDRNHEDSSSAADGDLSSEEIVPQTQ